MRIVLATFGSLGDLHPFLALSRALALRGHEVCLATHEYYRRRAVTAGLRFHPLRPDYDPSNAELNQLLMDPWRGTERILRRALFPVLRETFDDLMLAVKGADLLVSHAIVFPARAVAELSQIPWATAVLAPSAFFSRFDPPRATPLPWVNELLARCPGPFRRIVEGVTRRWCEPVFALRRALGLPPGPHPLMEGQHAPDLSLALFSPAFAVPQPDWPEQVRQTGFLFYDAQTDLPDPVRDWLDDGPPPIVFTLGTAAVLAPGRFYAESFEAVRRMGCRAILLMGAGTASSANAQFLVTDYAPFHALFPRAAAVVHQSGIGTTAQTLRAGVPSLAVPFAHDQPDNAARLARLGTGRSLRLRHYTAENAVPELVELLGRSHYRAQASCIAEAIGAEDPGRAACDAIAACFGKHSPERGIVEPV